MLATPSAWQIGKVSASGVMLGDVREMTLTGRSRQTGQDYPGCVGEVGIVLVGDQILDGRMESRRGDW